MEKIVTLMKRIKALLKKYMVKSPQLITKKTPLVLFLKSESSEIKDVKPLVDKYSYAETIEEEEPLSLHEKELEMIKQALIRSKGKRKLAAEELGISERTLYRKIKQFDINDLE